MRVLNFEKFKLLELKGMENVLTQNKIYNLKIVDNEGEHYVSVLLSSYGWSLHREIIYYEFTITDSNSDIYLKDGLLILGLDFDKKHNTFHLYPYFNNYGEHKKDQMSEFTKHAYIEII
jgi:hypothetical protein